MTLTLQETPMTTIRIDEQDYELESLPDTVRDELVSLKFVQDELYRLEMMKASLKNAETIYGEALERALDRWKRRNGQPQEDDLSH